MGTVPAKVMIAERAVHVVAATVLLDGRVALGAGLEAAGPAGLTHAGRQQEDLQEALVAAAGVCLLAQARGAGEEGLVSEVAVN